MGAIFVPSLMAFAHVFLNTCAESVSEMPVANNSANVTGETLRFMPPYFVDKYLHSSALSFGARWFVITPMGSTLTVMDGHTEPETEYECWQRSGKQWSGRQAVDDYAHDNFMHMLFVRPFLEVPFERRLARLLPRQGSDGFSSAATDLDFCCDDDHVRKE